MKILVVEDSNFFQQVVKADLKGSDYVIESCTSGADALEVLAVKKFDLLIISIELPQMSGIEICKNIKSSESNLNYETPFIFLTSSSSLEDREKGFSVGGVDFINKKFNQGDLLNAVNEILRPVKKFKDANVLLVDDSVISLKVAKYILETKGITVYTASNGKEGLDLFIEKNGLFDMVITDNEMPIMNGLELTKSLRESELGKSIPIIIITATYDREKNLLLFDAGANDYIVKPFIKEEFISRLRAQLYSKRVVSS